MIISIDKTSDIKKSQAMRLINKKINGISCEAESLVIYFDCGSYLSVNGHPDGSLLVDLCEENKGDKKSINWDYSDELLLKGLSVAYIARKLGVSWGIYVKEHRKKYKISIYEYREQLKKR